VFKKYKKLRKIKIYKKKKLRDQVGNLAIFLPINTGLHNTHKKKNPNPKPITFKASRHPNQPISTEHLLSLPRAKTRENQRSAPPFPLIFNLQLEAPPLFGISPNTTPPS